jgi:hypothetical protein
VIEFGVEDHGWEIAREAKCAFNPLTDTVISRVGPGGKLLGGVIFQDYTGNSMNIHVAGFDPKWINKDMLWVTFHYPFIQCNCRALFGLVPASNSKALEFDFKLGFKEVARIEDVFPDGPLVVVKMMRDECRWLKIRPKQFEEAA